MTKTILIVEDNELNLKLFTDLLRAHGYTVEGLRDGRSALDWTRAVKPDLVIMDIQLPHISGLELIETMQGCRRCLCSPSPLTPERVTRNGYWARVRALIFPNPLA